MGSIQDNTIQPIQDVYDCPIYDSDNFKVPKMDLEYAESLIIAYVKTQLDKRILLINDEKNDDIKLPEIPTNKYFSTWTEQVNNERNNFIYYNIVEVNTEGIGPATKQEFLMQIVVMSLEDINTHSQIWRRKMYRYGRVIKECIEKKSKDDGRLTPLEITTIIPQQMRINENSPLYKIGGVELKGAFA